MTVITKLPHTKSSFNASSFSTKSLYPQNHDTLHLTSPHHEWHAIYSITSSSTTFVECFQHCSPSVDCVSQTRSARLTRRKKKLRPPFANKANKERRKKGNRIESPRDSSARFLKTFNPGKEVALRGKTVGSFACGEGRKEGHASWQGRKAGLSAGSREIARLRRVLWSARVSARSFLAAKWQNHRDRKERGRSWKRWILGCSSSSSAWAAERAKGVAVSSPREASSGGAFCRPWMGVPCFIPCVCRRLFRPGEW